MEDEYLRMDAIVGVGRIYELLMRQYGDLSYLPSVEPTGYRDPLDDNTLIGKFQRLYQLQMGILAMASEDRQLDYSTLSIKEVAFRSHYTLYFKVIEVNRFG